MTKFDVIFTPPVVELIGVTQPIVENIQKVMDYRGNVWNTEEIEKDPLALVEFGGRVCYESFDNKKNRSRIDYIKDTGISKQHGSILEHAVFNLAVLDLPRSSLMELTRHRAGTAFSWRSTRYVDNWLTYACPPLLRGNKNTEKGFKRLAEENHTSYVMLKPALQELHPDKPRKEIVEAARSILMNCVTADGEFTVNLRELLHILKLRSDPGADASMQEFALELKKAAWPYIGELCGDI